MIVDQRSTPEGFLCAWAHEHDEPDRAEELHRAWRDSSGVEHDEARQRLIAEFPPSRWVTAADDDSGVRITVNGETVTMLLPATLRAVVEVEEKTSGPGRSSWSRHSEHEVAIELERVVDGDEAWVAVASVAVRRLGATQVTSGVLRDIGVGELVDWMLTRAPVVTGVDEYLGPGHPAAAAVRRATGRKSGKRGDRVVSPAEVAEVVRAAPPRGQDRALAQAFPHDSMRTVKRALAEARELGLVEHSARSRPSSSR